jgi:hypothetical protein
LADDYFGYEFLDAFDSGQARSDLLVLWRDPFGVARLSEEPAPPRGP